MKILFQPFDKNESLTVWSIKPVIIKIEEQMTFSLWQILQFTWISQNINWQFDCYVLPYAFCYTYIFCLTRSFCPSCLTLSLIFARVILNVITDTFYLYVLFDWSLSDPLVLSCHKILQK